MLNFAQRDVGVESLQDRLLTPSKNWILLRRLAVTPRCGKNR